MCIVYVALQQENHKAFLWLCHAWYCMHGVNSIYTHTVIGASEASPFLVMNVAILSVCVCVLCHGPARYYVFCTRDPLPTFT